MNKNYLLLLEDYHLYDDRIFRLLEKKSFKGFGLYLYLLTELTRHPDNKCGINTLRRVSRQARVTLKTTLQVVTEFDLFEINGDGESILISSPYLDKLMKEKIKRAKRQSYAGRKRTENSLRNPNGQFTGFNQPIYTPPPNNDKLTEEEGKENNWEKFIDEAMNDESWTDIQGMNSGMGKIFLERKEEIFKAFKIHIRLQGKEHTIQQLYDAKSYFSNFIRKGNIRRWILSLLEKAESEQAQNDAYRFETIDPNTGARSYYGNPIPGDAPPRPSEDSIWDNVKQQWAKYS